MLRHVLAAILFGAPLPAQGPTDDARDVLVSVIRRAREDANITTAQLNDTALTRRVAARLNAHSDTGVITLPNRANRPTADVWSMRMQPPEIRGDSASVRVYEYTTSFNKRTFMQGTRFTLIKRDGRWVVTDAILFAVS